MKIRVLNTSKDDKIKDIFDRLANDMGIDITFDIQEIGKDVEKHSYVEERNQCNLESIIDFFDESIDKTIIIIEKDLYFTGLNWCFGGYTPSHGCIIISTARLQSENHMYDLIGHEMGHLLNTCPEERTNTIEMLGSHCTNDLCVMQQKMTVKEAVEYTTRRHEANAPLYCEQCINDIKKYD